MNSAERFRRLLASPGALVCPGVYDALGARLVEDTGFKALYMTGNGAMASLLGKPDLGLATMTEMVGRARQLAACVDIPLICDADTGYGGLINVHRTVREFEAAGAAGIHIEDQITQKRCGALGNVQVVSGEEAAARIETAVSSRRSDDFFIIARTDSKGVLGFEEALRRVRLFALAGADAVMVEGLDSMEEIRRVVEASELPVLYNIYERNPADAYSVKELEAAGVKIIINCLTATLYSAAVLKKFYQDLRDFGSTAAYVDKMMPMAEYTRVLGIEEELAIQSRY